ncbi:MAG TPA: DNA-binding domain-containing protein [Rickettsiales bacterium]|nr:DNA-binding domain-containing protein [Rickettsiales bacterium]
MTLPLRILKHFQTAIVSNNADAVTSDIKPGGHFDVYAEGYRIRLSQALEDDYPSLAALLGEKEFDRLALEFIAQCPSQDYNLDRYPHGFCTFLCEKLQNRFAVEVALLEHAIATVFMAEDSAPLSPEILQTLAPESLAALRLLPRKAFRLLHFDYPVNGWLDTMRAENNAPPSPAPQASYVCIVRHKNNVHRHELSAAGYALLSELALGHPVEDALVQAIGKHPAYEADILAGLQSWFHPWLENGFFRIDS